MSTDKIKVAVRVRPFNKRELDLGAQCVVEMDKQQTILHQPSVLDKIERKPPKTFAFDNCFYSIDPSKPNYASQEVVFNTIGKDILDWAFQGYNACIFAYGQTGSGKSYTMMGSQNNRGVIPRLCDSLFDLISCKQSNELSYKVEVSYMEIYNEKVHDLLNPKTSKQSLKVREHNVLGPYVDGLSKLAVTSFQRIDNLMAEGNKSRTVAATNMNNESSRSHAVFTIILTQTLTDQQTGVTGEKVSRMSLVDLAGSERAVKTGAMGERLKEGSNINKSLATLGLVISKLADQSSKSTKNNKDKFVPYRDSVLTWLLKDNLGGNSKTVMVATISPAADNYEETLSTLRYADRAKRIVNHAVVNEDPNAKIIRELTQEVEALREMLKHATGSPVGDKVDIHQKLSESEKLYKEVSQTWEEKLKNTEIIQNERQQTLEKMGISIQASGIKVEKNKFYLVNLNADPHLNELLVYYLKERTVVGAKCDGTDIEPDIQLSGLGIHAQHCVITIEDTGLYLEPFPNARSYVNGSQVTERTLLKHGDRIVWGNHHYFRVNCPRLLTSSEPQTPAQNIDYNFARDELMLNELSNDPIQSAITKLEKQHEEDKQVALEKQRLEYERQLQQIRNIMSPSTPHALHSYDSLRNSFGKTDAYTPTTQAKVEKWTQERDEVFERSMSQLKHHILQANALVQEANILAEEMQKQVKFSVTLQIPPANLSLNRRKGAFISEPAILVKRGNLSQVWSMEKLYNKIVDMRDLYDEMKEQGAEAEIIQDNKYSDPFFDSEENHNLIGVANLFLEALIHGVKLDYHTPIISQQGEVAGRLQVELSRVCGSFSQDFSSDVCSECSNNDDDDRGSHVTCRIRIKQASGLPLVLSHYVFCQYSFWGYPPVVVPAKSQDSVVMKHRDPSTIIFDHVKDFTIPLTEEFMEHCAEGAVSFEVWGNKSTGFSKHDFCNEREQHLAAAQSLADRWSELTRKIELWVEIHELNDLGDYEPVEVLFKNNLPTGGLYQLRQGQQRRIKVKVKPAHNSGTLPIICQQVVKIEIGGIMVRNHLQKPLDSYQEEDLTVLREKWSEALLRRRQYLDQQIKNLLCKESKSEQDIDREEKLMEQWVNLTEERNAVLLPAAGSGIPGAPAVWSPPLGMEPYIPVLFLDLNADDFSTNQFGEGLPLCGTNSILPKEVSSTFYNLHIIHHPEDDVCGIAIWDSSIHNSVHLNKVTESNERVYMILRVTVRLSHPAPMDLVLRKRLAVNIYKRQSLTDKLDKIKRKIVRSDTTYQTGVTYEVVSNIPKASEELEDRESLAQLAASGDDTSFQDGETYIEKYTRCVSAVESILTLDRLRQTVAVKELLQTKGQTLMRKTVSVPNFSQLKLDLGTECHNLPRSESVSELSSNILDAHVTLRRPNSAKEPESSPPKSFGLARPTYLNLNQSTSSSRLQRLPATTKFHPSNTSPASSKLYLRMTTLHEEQLPLPRKYSLGLISDKDADDTQTWKLLPTEKAKMKPFSRRLPSSRTLDSLTEFESKVKSPSLSSGYESQAISSTNISSDDSASIKSVDETVIDETMDTCKAQFYSCGTSFDISDAMSGEISSKIRTYDNPIKDDIDVTSKKATLTLKLSSEVVGKRSGLPKQHSLKSVTHSQNTCHSLENLALSSTVERYRNVFDNEEIEDLPSGVEDQHTNNTDHKSISDVSIPSWMVIGESVLIKPYNFSGVIAFTGNTKFASGTWVGIELNVPKGKNDGSVQGFRYFSCRPKHGMFVRPEKLILDHRKHATRTCKIRLINSNKCATKDNPYFMDFQQHSDKYGVKADK